MADVAIGFRDHSGWAVAVVVSTEPAVLGRRRLELCDPDLPRQVYHAAAGKPLDRAGALVTKVEANVVATASSAVAELAADLLRAGHRVRAVGVPVGTVKVPEDLGAILGSHPMLHAAEGELYREALADSAEAAGLPVVRFVAKSLMREASAITGRPIEETLATLGRNLGPPWAKDQKEAAAAALLALHTAA